MKKISLRLFLSAVLSVNFAAANVLNPNDILKKYENVTGYGGSCFVVPKFPESANAKYKKSDTKKEEKLCNIDFDNANIGLCPKVWSTSPATILWDLSKTIYAGNSAKFEKEICALGRKAKPKTVANIKKLGAFKQTVSAQYDLDTSATFAQSNVIYYHFSRYFDTTVDIPVAVLRTANVKAHQDRVVSLGKKISKATRNKNGWELLSRLSTNPGGYKPSFEIFDTDGVLYGVVQKGSGDRYGYEWSVDPKSTQGEDLKRIPGLKALKRSEVLDSAINKGLAESLKTSPQVSKAISKGVSKEQMVLWMEELSEMIILDYMFNQQDRIRNFDYIWQWYYVDADNKLASIEVDGDDIKKASEYSSYPRNSILNIKLPAEIPPGTRAVLVQKTQLIDNDAGIGTVRGGSPYSNVTKNKHYAEELLNHIKPATYSKLVVLADDFKNKGDLYKYLSNSFSISPKYVERIASNTIELANILIAKCKKDELRFDLDSDFVLATGKMPAENRPTNCEKPE